MILAKHEELITRQKTIRLDGKPVVFNRVTPLKLINYSDNKHKGISRVTGLAMSFPD